MKKFIIRSLIIIILAIACISALLITSGFSMYKEAISEVSIETKINEIRSQENYTNINDMPEMYKNGVVAVEDHRFYNHKGVDYIGVVRAICRNILSKELVEGGSTITQQLAKNTYFSMNKQIVRKIAEIFVAKDFENKLSKDEILELYANNSYFGDGYYNLRDAAKGYFGKEPKDLNDYEATLLAGVPNAPSVYSPTVNFDLCTQRQKKVLNDMVKYGYISEIKKNEIIGQAESYRVYFQNKKENVNNNKNEDVSTNTVTNATNTVNNEI